MTTSEKWFLELTRDNYERGTYIYSVLTGNWFTSLEHDQGHLGLFLIEPEDVPKEHQFKVLLLT